MSTRLKEERQRRRWSIDYVAEHCGISDEKTIRRWESGESMPKMSNLLKLCDLFDMKPEELGFGLDAPTGGN